MPEKQLPKTLVVGLDAACWEYVDPLLRANRLPNLARLIGRGSYGTLHSVMPPITPVAWSSLVTGVNPGKHGIYEWVKRSDKDYRSDPVNARDRIGTTVWERLNAAGVRTGVMNIPLTYPPTPVEGFLLCGFSTPSSVRDLSYPVNVLAEVEGKFGPYKADVKTTYRERSARTGFREERELQAQQVRIAAWLAEVHRVDVLMINLMLLDHANHLIADFKTVEQAIVESDEDIGVLLQEFQPDNVLVISDHGSRRVEGVFLLQAWLAEKGYLKRPPRNTREKGEVLNFLLQQWRNGGNGLPARISRRLLRESLLYLPRQLTAPLYGKLEEAIPLASLKADTQDAFDPEGSLIYLPGGHRANLTVNLSGREPKGIVGEKDEADLIDRLQTELAAVLDPETREPIFQAFYRPDSLYAGPFVSLAPDLTCDYYSSRWSIVSTIPGLNTRVSRYFLSGDRWYGDHSREGIYVLAGAEFVHQEQPGEASLLDIPATLLYLYDVPQPEDYDGTVLLDTFRPERVARSSLTYQPGDTRDSNQKHQSFDISLDQEIRDRLVALGYLDG